MSRIEQNHRLHHPSEGTKRNPIDRRVVRTRHALHQALLSLIVERGYDAITVEDICERADISRSTFYAHFTSKDDLKQNHLKRLRQTLLEKQRSALDSVHGSARLLAFSPMMFEHARGHVKLYQALVGSGDGAIALSTIRQTLCEFVRGELVETGSKDSKKVSVELTVQCIVGAYMALLTWWLDGGAKLPPHQMDEIFRRLMTKGVASSSV